MPVYEYRCQQCKRKIALYSPTFSSDLPLCPSCGTNTLQRLFSTFSVAKTDRDIYEGILNDSQLTDGMMRDDPKALAEWNKRMSRGEQAGPEYQDMLGKMEKGEMPAVPSPSSTDSTPSDSKT